MTHPHLEGYSFTETFIPALFSVRYFGDTTTNKMNPVVKEPKREATTQAQGIMGKSLQV